MAATMSRRLYLLAIEFWWKVEHFRFEAIAVLGYRHRKLWEHKYVARFNENIYGEKFN